MKKEMISKRKIQAAETKKKIYETAKELFLEYGVDNVSVDSIVEAAGISKGAFYLHYESKDALASILITDYVKEIDSDYKNYLETIGNDVSSPDILLFLTEKVAEILENKIGFEKMKILYKLHITKTIDTQSSVSYNRDLYTVYSDILERGITRGEFTSDLPVNILVNHLVLAMRGITFEWCIRYPDFNLKEQFLAHFKILLNGITKPK